jgi:MFS family permease
VAIPLVIASVSATQAMMVVVLYAFAYLLALVYSGPTVSMIYGVIPADLRAFSIGVLLFAVNLIGLGLGPVIVGALSDRFAPSPDALGRAMQIMSFIYVPAAMFYLIAARYAEYDMATNAGKS